MLKKLHFPTFEIEKKISDVTYLFVIYFIKCYFPN